MNKLSNYEYVLATLKKTIYGAYSVPFFYIMPYIHKCKRNADTKNRCLCWSRLNTRKKKSFGALSHGGLCTVSIKYFKRMGQK